jgi:hypothetical protein
MTKSNIEITDTVESNLPSVLEIYNDVILTSTAVYTEQPVDLRNRLEWWRARTSQGFPVLVARRDDEILGFASFGEFRSWPCYAGTVEHSVHVHAQPRGSDAFSNQNITSSQYRDEFACTRIQSEVSYEDLRSCTPWCACGNRGGGSAAKAALLIANARIRTTLAARNRTPE